MGSKINRIGEENINTFGGKMIITRYKTNSEIDVYFPEYDWIAKNVQYVHFKKGNIKCPYERRVYGIGYLGEGKYKAYENGKTTKCYDAWKRMLQRCYDPKFHEKEPTYIDCKVDEEWLCFQNFAEWFYNNYYEIEGERIALDKDILHRNNKIYSPNNCIFVPERINTLFIKCDSVRGDCPVGVYYHKRYKKFVAHCSIYDFEENKSKRKYLGLYDTPKQAFEVYKQYKEKNIKDVADYYKEQIPNELYQALYKYEVNISD